MKMDEGENATKYGARMKEVVSAIRSLGVQLQEEIVSRKYLRNLLPIYAIRVSSIQDLRCVQGNTLTFEGIIGRLDTFELSNFDNYKPENLESIFKAFLPNSKANPAVNNRKNKSIIIKPYIPFI